LKTAEDFQIMRTKYKEITTIFSENKIGQQPSKKVKEKQLEKYHGNTRVKMRVLTPMKDTYMLGKIA